MKNTGRTVVAVTALTLLCRALSLLGYQAYMSFYDAETTSIGIFVYALKFPDVIFTSVGTALTTVVVPMYSSMLAKNERARADMFLSNIISVSGLLLIALVIAGAVAAPVFPAFSGYSGDAGSYAYAVFCLRTLMPVMFFFGLSFIFQGMLQSNGRFFMPACVSLPTSVLTVAYIFFFGDRFGVTGLLFVMLAGLSLQAVFLVPSVIATGYRYRPSFGFKDPELVAAAKMTPPVLAGVSAYQINMVFNVSMATYFGATALLRLNNAQNLMLAAALSFVYSITAVYFPKLTASWASGDADAYRSGLSEAIVTALFFLLPLSAGFILLRYRIFDLLARWGSFGAEDVRLAGDFFGLYSLGMIAMGLKEILDRGFYAQKNTKISAAVGFLIMGANVAFSLILMRYAGAYALPVSFSASCTVGAAALILIMRKKCGAFFAGATGDAIKCAASAAVMCAAVALASYLTNRAFSLPEENVTIAARTARLVVPAAVGACVYFAAAYLLRVRCCRRMFAGIIKKRGAADDTAR